MEQTQEIKNWLELQAPRVKSNIEIIGSDSGLKMLHISFNNRPSKFIPVIGHRQAVSEDRTVPRICVAPSLLGCILGYAQFESSAENFEKGRKYGAGKITYQGGFKLYKFDYEFAVKPNEKLVYDQKYTDEHWLVTYNKNTIFYAPTELGELFVRKIEKEFGPNTVTITYYLKLTELTVLSINTILSPGYYKVKSPASFLLKNWADDKSIKVTKISEEDYFKNKSETAALLSLSPNAGLAKLNYR